MTLTLTRTVSPTPNSGTDFFSIVDVTDIIAWVGFIAPYLLRFYALDFRHEEYYTTRRERMQCGGWTMDDGRPTTDEIMRQKPGWGLQPLLLQLQPPARASGYTLVRC